MLKNKQTRVQDTIEEATNNSSTNELPGLKRNGSSINNGTYIIFGADNNSSRSSSQVEMPVVVKKQLPALRKRHRKLNPTFLKRRLLSINDIEPSTRLVEYNNRLSSLFIFYFDTLLIFF